jgi:hypothetical protein
MPEQFYGFRFAYRLCGRAPTVQPLVVADAAFAAGDLVNLETGEVDLAATDDTSMVGAVQETKSGMTTSTDKIEVITDRDAVYEVYDANARKIGATLDIAGTTGLMTVASSSHADLLVMADSAADELTLVMINPGEHWQHP